MEGSFRLSHPLDSCGLLCRHPIPGRRGPHTALPLRVWSRQGTVDPVSQPFRVLSRGDGCGGPTRRKLPSLQASSIQRVLSRSPSSNPYIITVREASPPSPGTTHLLCLVNWPVLDISYKWTRNMCPSVSASLTDHRVFKVHPQCKVCHKFIPFHGESHTTVCIDYMLLTQPSTHTCTHPLTYPSPHPSI